MAMQIKDILGHVDCLQHAYIYQKICKASLIFESLLVSRNGKIMLVKKIHMWVVGQISVHLSVHPQNMGFLQYISQYISHIST